jgi:hypothetical protein
MTQVQHSIRLPLALDKALRDAAARQEVSTYAVLQRSVRLGLSQMSGQQDATQTLADLSAEVGQINGRLVQLERLTERSLYVACAAYVFARASIGSGSDDPRLTEEVKQAFARQLDLAGGLS